MADLSQYSILLIFLMEVSCLTYLEYRAWRTFYTPLCALMIPYVIVLLITIAIAGNFGFYAFNYDSIFVWIFGLPLFALPSVASALLLRRYQIPVKAPIKETEGEQVPLVLTGIAILVTAALLFRLFQTVTTGFNMFGTEEFTEEFSGKGVWAHLREMLMPLLILSLYYVKKKDFLLWLLIALMFVIQFSYMVKGAIVIAIASALFMKLYTGKLHLNLWMILGAVVGGVVLFFIIYMVIPLLGNGGQANMDLVEFIFRHIAHYFTSGTLGWSYDLDQHVPDRKDFEVILSPFVNIYYVLTGQELVSPVNHIYWNTGINYTNVRTFFGTLYVYSDYLQFATYTMVASTIIYLWRILALTTQNIFIYIIHFYYCGLMAMGWFEFYLFHLSAIEIPIIVLFYAFLSRKEVRLG